MDESPPGFPDFPRSLARIGELAYDLWWSWTYQAREVFRQLDYSLWRLTAHNPVKMLRMIAPDQVAAKASDPAFMAQYGHAIMLLDRARGAPDTWWSRRLEGRPARPIAYFSAEFAIHQSLPIYAGGLGVLAGDHCKEASDLGLPIIGVGFMYPQGYFHQYISSEGWQAESYEQLNWADAPVEPAITPQGRPCVVAVPLGSRTVLVSVWRVRLGRVKLYLLDTDLEENAPADRGLSARLYGGDHDVRLQQEIILGMGGVRALRALGSDPAVWHLNEGHAAFVVLQRMHEAVERGRSFEAALEEIRATTIFTTHTPVAAGHDAFRFEMVEQHLAGAWGPLTSHHAAFLELGRHDNGGGPMFNMTALALRTAGASNAVSRLHGKVTTAMWEPVLQSLGERGTVRTVTNGVHLQTWVSSEMAKLFERHLGDDWRDRQDDVSFWDRVMAIPDEEVWAARHALRSFLFTFMTERARDLWTREKVSTARVVAAGTLLDPAALTIGFARRFTSYKRPELVFHDSARLIRILTDPRRPVQLVFAGKAHPADSTGKEHLQRVFARALDPAFGGRVAFVDDYDLHVAHFLAQGCDVWMNTPRKPMEASGTSGIKASVNGVPHLSVGDGWWAEGFTGSNGWLIDGGSATDDQAAADAADAAALYRLLEENVVPTFYARDDRGLPRAWLCIVKEAIRTVAPRFCTRRMVKEYAEGMYAAAEHQTVTP
jgi:starch phosphorylase